MTSPWKKLNDFPSFNKLNKNIKTDVLIIGGGLAGLLCAYTLHANGINYVLLESDKIASKTTENTTAKITSQHGLVYRKIFKKYGIDACKQYYQANQEAIEKYLKISKNIDCDLEQKNSFVYSLSNKNILEEEFKILNKIGCKAKLLDNVDLPFKTVGAVKFENQFQFNPLKFISAISRDLNIYEDSAVLSYDGNKFHTATSEITAKKAIVTTHFPFFNKHGLFSLKMYQHRSYVLALENAEQLDGMYVDETQNGMSFRNYNNLLFIGGGSNRTGKKGGSFNELEEFKNKYYKNAKIVNKWATQDCITLDGIPYIGRYYKNSQDLFVATGFNKWGMTSSMVSALLLSDLILEKENKYETLFSPSRSIMSGSLIINSFESIINLLTPTTPRCPHLGCALKWNKYEKSWDCPCHGSRFNKDGRVLNGPANGNLKV